MASIARDDTSTLPGDDPSPRTRIKKMIIQREGEGDFPLVKVSAWSSHHSWNNIRLTNITHSSPEIHLWHKWSRKSEGEPAIPHLPQERPTKHRRRHAGINTHRVQHRCLWSICRTPRPTSVSDCWGYLTPQLCLVCLHPLRLRPAGDPQFCVATLNGHVTSQT